MNKKFFFIFSMVMALAYVVFGIFLIFFDKYVRNLIPNDQWRWIFGILLIIYGLVRSWRSYSLVKNHSEEQ